MLESLRANSFPFTTHLHGSRPLFYEQETRTKVKTRLTMVSLFLRFLSQQRPKLISQRARGHVSPGGAPAKAVKRKNTTQADAGQCACVRYFLPGGESDVFPVFPRRHRGFVTAPPTGDGARRVAGVTEDPAPDEEEAHAPGSFRVRVWGWQVIGRRLEGDWPAAAGVEPLLR